MENDRSTVIDLIKGFLISLVVLGHSIQYGSGQDYLVQNLFYENFLFKVIYSFHMPFFIAVCGYLFFFSVQKHTFKEVLKRKILTVVLPIFAWNLLFQFFYSIYETHTFSFLYIITTWLKTSFSVHWFLWAVFMCSVTMLLMQMLFHDKFWICFMMAIILQCIPLPLFLQKINYASMFLYFMLAYFYAENKEKINIYLFGRYRNRNIVICSITYIVLFFLNQTGLTMEILRRIDSYIIAISGCISIYLTVSILLEKKLESHGIVTAFVRLGNASMGIYIISGYIFNWILPRLTKNIQLNYIVILVETFLVIGLSYGTTIILRKFKWMRKALLGDR